MGIKKKVMAVVLIAAMTMSSALTVSAASSPTKGNKSYNTATKTDSNKQDHINKTVTSKLGSNTKVPTSATVVSVKSKAKGKKITSVVLRSARNKNNKVVAITKVGTGKKGVFNSKSGRRITHVRIASSKKVTVSKIAFKGSKVKKLILEGKTVISKNAFNGTKVKNLKITISGSKKKASAFTFKKGAFKGLNKKAKVIVSKSTMTKKEFKKLQKKLKAAGFAGTIVRK